MIARPPLHIACYGSAGARKTTFFATMPKPLVVAHFDAHGKDMPYWRLGRPQELEKGPHKGLMRRVLAFDSDETVCRIEYYHDPIVDNPKAAARFLDRLNRLPGEIEAGEVATFCFETVTSSMLSTRKMYQYDLDASAKDPRKWYGGSVDVLEEILLIQLPALACNVCVGLHVSKTKVEAEGTMLRAPLLPGRLMDSFASQWPEIYRAYVTVAEGGERAWLLQTTADERFEAASQIRAPDPCWPRYGKLWETWDQEHAAVAEKAAKTRKGKGKETETAAEAPHGAPPEFAS
jgi:hypothetical protein